MRDTIIVTAFLTPNEGQEEEVLSALKKVQAASRQEAGCLTYNLHKSVDDNTFVLYEEWANKESIEKHINSNHYQEYRDTISDRVSDRQVFKLEAID
jgi:quinol monooxygenase YgiN